MSEFQDGTYSMDDALDMLEMLSLKDYLYQKEMKAIKSKSKGK